MSNLWERFDNIVNANEVAEARSQFSPIQAGDYEAVLEEIAPSESKNGLPMIKGKFRTVEGNRILFYNQMLQNINYPNMTAVNVAEAVAFISGLLGEEVEFTSLGKFAEVIESVPIGGIYKVNVSYGKNDYEMKFPKLKIEEKLDGNDGLENVAYGFGEELPFN